MSIDVEIRTRTRFKTQPIEIALVGGCFPRGNRRRRYLACRFGGATFVPGRARLFSFDLDGFEQAIASGRRLRDVVQPNGVAFTSRVLIINRGQPDEEVIEAWRLEGPEPVDLKRYWFQ